MRRFTLLLITALAGNTLWFIDESPVLHADEKRPVTPYGLLYNEWKAEVNLLEAATPKPPASELKEAKKIINARYTARFLELAKRHTDDDVWLDCLIWTSVEGQPGAERDAMFDLLKDHAHSLRNWHQLTLLMSEFIPLRSDRVNPALRSLAEDHPQAGVRGAALHVLAAREKKFAEEDGDEQRLAASEKLLERVLAEYPEVSTYRGKNRDNAEALLAELRSPVALLKPAPETLGKTLAGDDFQLREAIRGKVAVLSFSGHWCGPCVAMHPVQQEILAKFPRDKVVIVEFNSDPIESIDKVRAKVVSDGIEWTLVTDGSDGPIAKQWQISSWPTYVVVDATGRIRRRVVGNLGRRLFDWVEELDRAEKR